MSANAIIDGSGKVLIRTGKGEVIHLAENENKGAFNGGRVDGAVMGSTAETKLRRSEDGINVFLPETAGFRMTLEGMLYRQHMGTVQALAKLVFIPISVGVINSHEGGMLRRRGMGIGISGIPTIHTVSQMSSKGKEEALDGLFNTRGVGGGNAMEKGSSFRRSIATIVRAASAIMLDRVLPVWA